MKITSTEFQQNVGYYLKEAERGKIINIFKLKPTKASFKLIADKNSLDNKQKSSRKAEILKLIKELNISDSSESARDFQNRVRS